MRDLRVRLESSLHPLDDADSGSGSGDLRGDFDLNPDYRSSLDGRAMKPAAVLVPLVERRDGTSVLLTQRTEHLNDHAGQISFPGGSIESVDADAVAAALRETDEEIGIQPDLVEILGFLDTYETGTGFRITPVVGFVDSGYTLELDDFVVAEVFEVPLAFRLRPGQPRTPQPDLAGPAPAVLCHQLPKTLHLGGHGGHAGQPLRQTPRQSGGAMIWKILKYAIPFLLPFLAYGLWIGLGRLRRHGQQQGWREAPWMWLTIVGVVLLIASLFIVRFTTVDSIEGDYTPARLEDGRIVPGSRK